MSSAAVIEEALSSLNASGKNGDRAFEVLYEDARRVLRLYFQKRAISLDLSEDAIQTVLGRIWENRSHLQFENSKRWYAYLYTSVRNYLKDSGVDPSPPLPDREDTKANVWTLVTEMLDRHRLYELADQVWLGKEPHDSTARCLAAHLIYLDGCPPEEVLEMVGFGSAVQKPSCKKDLVGLTKSCFVD